MKFPFSVHAAAGAACAALALCASSASLAQTPPTPAPTSLPEIGRVVTSDRQDEPSRDAARTTYTITKAQMLQRGDASIADALSSIPGVTVERYGGLGSTANIYIRGSSSAQVLVLLDGRPVGGQQTDTLDVGEISTSGVERIEVVEGGGATLYGTGAIGGVVNIITTHPSNAPLVRVSDGSFDTQSFDLETQHVTFQRLVSANDYPYLAYTVPSGTRVDADFASTTLRLRDDAMLGAVHVDGSLGLAAMHLGVPGPIALPFASPEPNPALPSSYQSSTTRQNSTYDDARLSFVLDRGNESTALDLSGTRNTLLFYSSPGDPAACSTALGTKPCNDLNQETRLQASLRQTIHKARQRLVYGLDIARGNARIDAGGGPAEAPVNAFAQTAAYLQDALAFGAGSAYAGVRAERDGGQGGAVAPSLGGVMPLSADVSLRTNFAVGFRAPDAVDLYYPGFSNPNLQPERTQNFDATLADSRLLGGAELTWFTVAGNDLIVVNPAFNYSAALGPSNEPIVNAEHASIAGFTLDAHTPLYQGWTTTVGVTNLYRALNLTTTASRLVGRPVLTASFAVEYHGLANERLAGLGFIANGMSARSFVPPIGTPDPSQYAAGYTTLQAYVRYRVAPRALLTVRAANLFDERYASIASPPFGGYPAPGRSYAVELSTR